MAQAEDAAPQSAADGAAKPANGKQLGGKKQVVGGIISPDWVVEPSRAIPYLKEAADHGYQTFEFFVRHQKRTVLDPAVRDAVRELVSATHRHGMRAMLDTDPSFWGSVFAERHPESALHVVKSVEATCRNGAFSFTTPLPPIEGMSVTTTCLFGIPAAFRPDGDDFARVPASDLSWQWMNANEGVCISGNVKGGYDGKLIVYVQFRTFAYADLAHADFLKTQQEILDMYRGIPLDGFGWDEPNKGLGRSAAFKTGEGFAKFFQKQNGYSLEDKLVWLDHGDGLAKAVKVRCDYYRTLADMNYIAQKEHNDYARKLFGEDLTFGTHQTWCGLPPDLVAGDMDYFKLGKVLTAAWTDGAWEIPPWKVVAYNFMLAESLKKELRLRDAYYNDWGSQVPAVEDMRFANRFKMLYHINWFNIFFSDSTESILNYRLEPLRTHAKEDVANLDAFDAFIGDRFSPHTDVAILYAWESIAGCPKWLAESQYTVFMDTSLCLADSGLFGSMVSSDGVIGAEVEKKTFAVSGHRYRVLVVPLGVVLRKPVYEKIMRMCAAGVPVVFFGPPPAHEAETGKDIAAQFAETAGFKPFSFGEYETLKKEWESSRADFVYPVSATSGSAVKDREGRTIVVRSAKLPLWYMPALNPREDLVNCIAPLTRPLADVFADGTYYRYFTDPKRNDAVIIVVVAKGHVTGTDLVNKQPIKNHTVKALFRFPEGELTARGGTWAAIRLEHGRMTGRIGDCPDVRWTESKQAPKETSH